MALSNNSKQTKLNVGQHKDEFILHMKDRNYYLVRNTNSSNVSLIYNFASFEEEDGVTEHDIRTVVFYEQKKSGLWGWDCGMSVIDFQQNVKFGEVLAEVSGDEVDALFDVMWEAINEAKSWMDDTWKESGSDFSHPYYCMYEDGKYLYFTFMNKDTLEQVCIWSDLLVHGFHTNSLIAPDGSWGKYYDIPLSVFNKACELHKEMSNKFVRQYRDFVLAKTGITIDIKK